MTRQWDLLQVVLTDLNSAYIKGKTSTMHSSKGMPQLWIHQREIFSFEFHPKENLNSAFIKGKTSILHSSKGRLKLLFLHMMHNDVILGCKLKLEMFSGDYKNYKPIPNQIRHPVFHHLRKEDCKFTVKVKELSQSDVILAKFYGN